MAISTFVWLPLVAACQKDVQVYSNPDEGAQIVVPAKGFTLRDRDFEWGFPGTVCEIENPEMSVQGVVRVLFRKWMTPNGYADWREESLRKTAGVKNLTRIDESTPSRDFGSWIQRDWLVELSRERLRYVFLAATRGSRVAEFLLWVDVNQWEATKETLYRIVNSAIFQSVWYCGNCTRRVIRKAAACAACGTPVYPPDSALEEFSRKNDIQIITQPSETFMKALYVDGKIGATCPGEKLLARFLPTLRTEISRYPERFFRGVDLERMIVGAELAWTGHEGTAGLATVWNATILYRALDGLILQESDRRAVHHEIMHFIDTRDDRRIEDPEWVKLNPWGFEYDRKKYGPERFEFNRSLTGYSFALFRPVPVPAAGA